MEDNIKAFLKKAEIYQSDDIDKIKKAIELSMNAHSGKERASGENVFAHCLATADILIDMDLDPDAIIAGLLHDILEQTPITAVQIKEMFGNNVEKIVQGVTRISILKAKNKTIQQAETIRKMLFAMTQDLRVILVKLADKLHNMRTLKYLPEDEQKRIATECLEIFAPLAERLGISWMKDELEDLSLKSLNRDAHDQIKQIVSGKKREREAFLKQVESAIMAEAEKASINIVIESRAKHFYSIYQKLKKRNKTIEELYDLLGIRIFCDTRDECYSMLGYVHSLWKPLDGRFKDYIAFPKANGYQSLHTTVMCYDGRLLEVQIRTTEMHRVAEYGVASHWLYKKGSTNEIVRPEDLPVMNMLKNWQEISSSSDNFLTEIKKELLKDFIFVFTPDGHVIQLSAGSTPIDFAYAVHSEVGNHCVGAKADGAIIPLNHELQNTQVIEILTTPGAHPHINWLRIAKSPKARSKIRQWLVQNDLALAIEMNIVAKKKLNDDAIDEKSKQKQTVIPPAQIIREVKENPALKNRDSTKLGISIEGQHNLMIRIAQCCNPTQGEPIIGFVSRGRGIIVHKKSCKNIPGIPDFKERRIDVEWENEGPHIIKRFRIVTRQTQDIFSEIEGAIRKFKGHLIEGKLDEIDGTRLSGTFTMELEKSEDVNQALKHIRNNPNIVSIQSI